MKNVLFVCLMLSAACSRHSEDRHDRYFEIPHYGERAVTVSSLTYDTLKIDGSNTSLLGKWYISADSLYYLDEIVARGLIYDKDGRFSRRVFYEGRGPNEVIGPATFFINLRDGGSIYGADINLYRFDRDYRKLSQHLFLSETHNREKANALMNEPDYREPSMYELDMWYGEAEQLGDNIVLPITTELIDYNGYEGSNTDDFYRNSYTVALLNAETLTLGKLSGGYPPVYRNDNIPCFKYHSMDVMDDKLFVGFNADPNIYVWDKDGELQYSFGEPADGMPAKYPATNTFSQYEDMEDEYREKYGHYTYVRCAGNHVFRHYRIGENYRMQIYDNEHNLTGDVETAQRFEVIGFISPYYYAVSKTADYETELLTIYRFMLSISSIDKQ